MHRSGCNRLLGSARCPSHESDHLIGGSYPTEGNVKSVQARLVHLLAERRASIANHYRLKATIGGFAGSGRHADVTRHPGHGHPLRALMTEPLSRPVVGNVPAETLLSTNSPASGFSASSISQLGSSTEGHTRLPSVATPSSPKDRSQYGSSRPSPASVPTAVKAIGDPTFRKQHRSFRTLGAVQPWPKSFQKAKKVQTPANRPLV